MKIQREPIHEDIHETEPMAMSEHIIRFLLLSLAIAYGWLLLS